MDWNIIACLLLILLTVCALAAILVLTRPRCPECGSLKLSEVSKEPLGMRDVSYHSGGAGGGYTSTQIMYRVKYRCNECQETWIITKTETK